MPYHRPISDPKHATKTSEGVDAIVQAEKMIQIAILLPCSAFIGWLAGAWLDKRLHQSWIAFAGILFGGFAGLFYVVRLALVTERQSRQTESKDAENDKDA
jgi:ATP synthase protein I